MADLIDRIELMRQIAEFGREIPKDQVMEVIARVPTTDRPKGEWVYHEDYKLDGECCYECSECGRMYDYKMNYCGYCGSDNRGRSE